MSHDSDDLSKRVQDKNFVNCNQDWEKDVLLQQGHSEKAINHCCSQDLGNNPRNVFNDCLIDYENKK